MIRRYVAQKKTVTAVQLCWKNWSEVCDIAGPYINENNHGQSSGHITPDDTCGEKWTGYIYLKLPTKYVKSQDRDDWKEAIHGNWIVKDSNGDLEILSCAEFHDRYELNLAHDDTVSVIR